MQKLYRKFCFHLQLDKLKEEKQEKQMKYIKMGHPKPNPYSDLQFLLNFLCALPLTPCVEKLYIGVLEGSISPFKSQCTIGVRWALSGDVLGPCVEGASS